MGVFFQIFIPLNRGIHNYQQELKGERKMQENTMTNGTYLDEGYITLRHEQLPTLTASDLHAAAIPDNIAFFADFMLKQNVGRYHWFERQGFTLQNAGAGVIRCVYVVDHASSLHNLALVNETVSLAGGCLELAPFTVVSPMLEGDKDEQAECEEEAGPGETPSQSFPQESSVVGMEVA